MFKTVKRGAQTKGRTIKTDKVERKVLPKRKMVMLAVALLLAGSIVAGIVSQKSSAKTTVAPQKLVVAKTENPTFKTPHSLAELLALSPAELEQCDIARMNLLCAEGLPGSENLNVDESLAMLDQWAQGIGSEIKRNYHHYREDPAYYYNSENFYKMLMMSVVLYDDYRIRYNPKWIETPSEIQADDHFAADSRDILIHGLTGQQRMGTCSSMPVLYVALGRRLGYPLKLVTTKAHLFLRWDSSTGKFNMDATGKGLNEYTDEHFKQWPFPVTEEEIKAEGYLQSLTSAQELSVFLTIRAMCLREAGRMKDAIAAHAAALRLEPNWRGNQFLLAEAEHEYADISSTAFLQQPEPKLESREDETEYLYQRAMTASRLRRAELGIPEVSPVPDPTPRLPFPK